MDKQEDKTPAKMKWTTLMTTDDFTIARAKADAVKGKVKKRPNGKFDVRVGQPVKANEKVEAAKVAEATKEEQVS
jgi:TRAP-type mannitol/chloroaromatic compound transport system substrate-binding protein